MTVGDIFLIVLGIIWIIYTGVSIYKGFISKICLSSVEENWYYSNILINIILILIAGIDTLETYWDVVIF